jgi:hypothetical protein
VDGLDVGELGSKGTFTTRCGDKLPGLLLTLRKDPELATDVAPAECSPQPRYANIAFALSGRLIAPESNLVPNTQYETRVDIGPHRPDSILEAVGGAPLPIFPDSLLETSPDGHWLQVVAASSDFTIAPDKFTLFLPHKGSSWVISVTTPKRGGEAELRIGIYFKTSYCSRIEFRPTFRWTIHALSDSLQSQTTL